MLYEDWLRRVVDRTMSRYTGDKRIVFINAWNEWAEGNHLEPDLKWGHAYLEATRRALTGSSRAAQQHDASSSNAPQSIGLPTAGETASNHNDPAQRYPISKKVYWRAVQLARTRFELLRYVGRRTKW
jgi:hypothetical protein